MSYDDAQTPPQITNNFNQRREGQPGEQPNTKRLIEVVSTGVKVHGRAL